MGSLAESLRDTLKVDGEAQEFPNGDATRILVTWDTGQAKLDVFEDHAEWKDLSSRRRGQRVMRSAHQWAREELKPRGIKYITATAADESALKTLKRHGDWTGDNGLRWEL